MRIGRMQGALVVYHTTRSLEGFQYLPLSDLEKRLFGCTEFAEIVYKTVLALLEKILD